MFDNRSEPTGAVMVGCREAEHHLLATPVAACWCSSYVWDSMFLSPSHWLHRLVTSLQVALILVQACAR